MESRSPSPSAVGQPPGAPRPNLDDVFCVLDTEVSAAIMDFRKIRADDANVANDLSKSAPEK